MSNNPSNSDPSGLTPNGSDPTGLTPNPSGLTPNGTLPKTSFESLPLDVQLYIKDLRKDEENIKSKLRQHEEAQRKQEEETQKALQERLKQQGEFQKLAEQHEHRVKELEPVQERYTALSGLLADQIKAQVKDWPKEVKDLLPGDDTPIEVRYAQVQKLQALAIQLGEKAQQQQRASLPGNKPNPQPSNSEQTREQQVQEFRLRRKQTGQYSI